MSHLDAQRWRDLLAGQLPAAEARALRAHLGQGCEQCEQVIAGLADQGAVDALDGAVDAALLDASAQPAATVFDEVGFARLQRALRSNRSRWWLGAGVTAVAAAAAVVLYLQPAAPTSTTREKGSPAAAAATRPRLVLEVLRLDGTTPTPLPRNSRIELGTRLVFRLVVDRPACVRLLRTGAASETLIDQPLCLDPGEHALTDGANALAYRAEVIGPMVLQLELVERDGRPQAGAIDERARFALDVQAGDR